MIAAYQRTGQGRPSDDESLEVDDDGSFRLRRTNGSSVAGSFAGTVPDDRLAALRAAASAVTDAPADDAEPPPSGRTIEYLATAEHGLALASGSTPPPVWGDLATVLRHLVLDLVDQPEAAIGAELADGGRRLVVRQLGPEAIEADPDSASISLESVDESGQQLGAWEAQLADFLDEVAEPRGRWRRQLGAPPRVVGRNRSAPRPARRSGAGHARDVVQGRRQVVDRRSALGGSNPVTITPVAAPTRRKMSFAEAAGNPCLTCTDSPCCTYLPLGTIAMATFADLDHAAHLLDFPGIELGLTTDGSWSTYWTVPCRHLVGGRCSLHGTPEKPHICVQYNPYACWYRPALGDGVGGEVEYLRIDRGRMQRVLEMVELDEQRVIVAVPTWDELVEAFADVPIEALADRPAPPPPADHVEAWQAIALGEVPRPPVPSKRLIPRSPATDPCDDCSAPCCTTPMFPIAAPQTASSLDHLRFTLGFPGTEVVVADGSWAIALHSRCRHLEGGRCSIYGQPERPVSCQYLDAWACSHKAVFETPRPDHAVRVRLEELPALVSTYAFDDLGVAATIPTADEVRAAIETSWAN